METIVIVSLGVMLIIALLQLRSKNQLPSLADFKISELESKYKSSLIKINERDEAIRLRDLEIFKLKKWHTNLTNVSKKTDEIIQDFILRINNSEKQKDAAIKKADKAIKLCKESVATIAHLRAELDSIEVLLTKYTPPPSLLP